MGQMGGRGSSREKEPTDTYSIVCRLKPYLKTLSPDDPRVIHEIIKYEAKHGTPRNEEGQVPNGAEPVIATPSARSFPAQSIHEGEPVPRLAQVLPRAPFVSETEFNCAKLAELLNPNFDLLSAFKLLVDQPSFMRLVQLIKDPSATDTSDGNSPHVRALFAVSCRYFNQMGFKGDSHRYHPLINQLRDRIFSLIKEASFQLPETEMAPRTFNSMKLREILSDDFDLIKFAQEAAGPDKFTSAARKIHECAYNGQISLKSPGDKAAYAVSCRVFEHAGFKGPVEENGGLIIRIKRRIIELVLGKNPD